MKPFVLHISTHLHAFELTLVAVKDAIAMNAANCGLGRFGTRRLL